MTLEDLFDVVNASIDITVWMDDEEIAYYRYGRDSIDPKLNGKSIRYMTIRDGRLHVEVEY